ncbi:hypothetical protein SESBI_00650 [Sesbania bispinosa]|nr:hypothetical protein SESBI_00650 [Sesbania bispinosa]
MASEVRVSGEGESTGVVFFGQAIEGETLAVVPGKKKVVDGGASSKQAVMEKKCIGSGSLRGYVLKVDSEEKDEADYDFVHYSWVDASIIETSSIYQSSEATMAFTEKNDFVRKDFQVKMSPKLDKSAIARRIAEKKGEVARIKGEQSAADVGELRAAENAEKSEQTENPKVDKALIQVEGVSKKRKRDKNVSEADMSSTIFREDANVEGGPQGTMPTFENLGNVP